MNRTVNFVNRSNPIHQYIHLLSKVITLEFFPNLVIKRDNYNEEMFVLEIDFFCVLLKAADTCFSDCLMLPSITFSTSQFLCSPCCIAVVICS